MSWDQVNTLLGQVNTALEYFTVRLKERERREIYQRAFSGQYPVIEAALPEAYRNTQSRFFSFGVPQDWWDKTAEQLNAIANFTVLAGVTSVDEVSSFFAGDLGFAESDEEAFGWLAYADYIFDFRERGLSRAQPTQKWGAPTRLSLDGHRSVLLQFTTQVPGHLIGKPGIVPVVLSELFVPRDRQIFIVTFSTPASRYQGLLPSFQAMLATWRWA
jgi:hypothetical protein